MATILVPTDFSPIASNAVQYAAALAKQTGGKLLLVHSVSLPASITPDGVPLLPFNSQLIEDCEEELQTLSRQLKEDLSFAFEVETFCLYGPLIPHLNELVKTQAVDLVVMGTHGATGLLDKLIGTNTSTFISEAPCPVLVVPAQAAFMPIQHIAYASDFETEETVYLKQLFQLASTFNAEVHIINIKSERQLNLVSDFQILKRINQHFQDNKYNVAQLKNDDVLVGLKEFAQENPVNLLALSIQSRSFIEDLFHSSLTKKLALHAFVPLLTLPAEPYHFQAQQRSPQKAAPI